MSDKLSRRNFLKFTGGALGISALAACAPVATTETGSDAGAEPVAETGSLWVLLKQDFHPSYNEYLRTKMAAYAEEQGWEIELADMAGFASGSGEVEKLAASVQSGDSPDLVNHDLSVVQVQNLGIVEPVSDIVSEIEDSLGTVSPYLHGITVVDDEWYAVPYHQRADGGWYRRSAFDEAGIDIQSIRTYSELAEACLEASNPEEESYGWGMTVNRSGDGNFLINRVKTGYGAGWQDETGQYIRTNSPEMIEAMTFLTDIYTNEKWAPMLPPGVLAWNDTSNNEAYLGGVVTFTQNGGTVYAKAVIDGNPVAEDTGYLKPPGGPVNQEFLGLNSKNWYMLTGAKNPEASRDMILAFTADVAAQDEMLASSPAYALPAYADLWEMSEFIQSSEIALQMKSAALDDSGINAGTWPGPSSPAMTALDESGIWNDMVNAMVTGTPVEEAVATAHDRMVLVFKEYGLPGEE